MKTLACLLLLTTSAVAHEAPSGWKYDHDCCHDRDCAPVENLTYLNDGTMLARTKHGEGKVTSQTQRRPSGDTEYHACIMPSTNHVICFYAPGGS